MTCFLGSEQLQVSAHVKKLMVGISHILHCVIKRTRIPVTFWNNYQHCFDVSNTWYSESPFNSQLNYNTV